MKKCKTCDTTKTSKWFSGPLCRTCYRAQPHVKEREKQSRLKRIDHYNEVAKVYSLKNKQRIKEKNKLWYENNKAHVIKLKKQYKIKNKDRIFTYENNYQVSRRKEDLNFRLRCVLRSRLSKAISNNRKAGSAVKDLGCSIEDLKKHLEAQFKPGMSWDNYGEWHVDHIKPLSKFDLSDPKQLKEACHYSNLQPLWASENLSKGANHER